MAMFIKYNPDNKEPVLKPGNDILPGTFFNLVRLSRGESFSDHLNQFESIWTVLSGKCSFEAGGHLFSNVGQRKDIWSGKADSIYAGIDTPVTVMSESDNTEIAVAGGLCQVKFPPFRITPDEVEIVDVGSDETHSHRRIFHILGHNGAGRAGNLLVSELYCEGGCWSGYPAHKHDTDNMPFESSFEELYHYRFNPPNGFGAQLHFDDDGNRQAFMTRSGDTFAFNSGYHPTVTSPGHREYIFTILVGKSGRSLIQNFKDEYRYLMESIPGINTMRDKFK